MLAEALIGIGLLGLVTASVSTLLPAALEAGTRAAAHHVALVVGDTLLEAGVAGIPIESLTPTGIPGGIRVESGVEHVHVDHLGVSSACRGPGTAGASRTTVHVKHGGRTDGREVILGAGPRIADISRDVDASLILRTDGSAGSTADALLLIGPDGEERAPSTTGPDCLRYHDLPIGTSFVTVADSASMLLDRTHVPITQRPIALGLDGRTRHRNLDVSSAGYLRVIVDDGGARRPETGVAAGAELQWLVRGDDANVATDLGSVRPVHPGLVTVVIPACGDASAIGSSSVITVPEADQVTLEVPLAVVTVEGIGDRSDVWLRFRRTSGCADESASRALLLFDGNLHDSMRVAIPQGEWDASLGSTATRALTGSVRFVAVGNDVTVRIP